MTLEIIADLDARERPATLGVRTCDCEEAHPLRYFGLDGYPLTRTTAPEAAWVLDRNTPMHCHRSLDYSIIANWVIAAHKSQGAFQMEFGRRTHECFWLFEVSGEAGATQWQEFISGFEQRDEDFQSRPVGARESAAG
jgi:hypothetical protein